MKEPVNGWKGDDVDRVEGVEKEEEKPFRR